VSWLTFILVALLVIVVASLAELRGTESLRTHFLNHLSFVTARGLPLAPAIVALAEERATCERLLRPLKAKKEAALLHGIAGRLQSHGSLAESCAEAPGFLAADQLDLLRRAEEGGGLPAVLEVLRDEEDERDRGRWRALEIGFYPLVVSLVVVPVSVFLTEVIVPKFLEIEAAMNLGTRFFSPDLMGAVNLGYVVLMGLAVCFLLPRQPGPWLRWQGLRCVSALPLLGRPLRRWRHARWLKRVSALLQFGATLPEALSQAAGVAGATPGQARAAELAHRGHPLGEVLEAGLAGEAPALVPSLTLTVDRVGNLPQGLALGAQRLTERANRRLCALAETLRPAPIVACAVVVATHSMGVWSGLLSLQRAVIWGTF
jgi:type II secretory pathway component PulF